MTATVLKAFALAISLMVLTIMAGDLSGPSLAGLF